MNYPVVETKPHLYRTQVLPKTKYTYAQQFHAKAVIERGC